MQPYQDSIALLRMSQAAIATLGSLQGFEPDQGRRIFLQAVQSEASKKSLGLAQSKIAATCVKVCVTDCNCFRIRTLSLVKQPNSRDSLWTFWEEVGKYMRFIACFIPHID